MKAGTKVTLKNNETFKKAMPSGVLFEDLYCTFLVGGKSIQIEQINTVKGTYRQQAEAVRKLGFRLLAKRAAVGSAKHVRTRPMFSPAGPEGGAAGWLCSGRFVVVDDRITDEALARIWEIAGLRIGLCDWRPDSPKSPGPYGRFRVELRKV